jgi:hypothetical protein
MTWNNPAEIANARVRFDPAPPTDATPDARSIKHLAQLWQLIEANQVIRDKIRYELILDAADELWRAHHRAVLWRQLRRWLRIGGRSLSPHSFSDRSTRCSPTGSHE